jgi:phage terminase large subunit-like protein
MVATKTKRNFEPVSAYARSVTAGRVVAGRLVVLACRRHLADLKDGRKRGLRFDAAAAAHAIDFFAFLMLPEGDQPFVLSPFQQFVVGSLFGWMGADGFRRFRTGYFEGGKGCGKSPLAAGIGLYGLDADGELAAEIYCAAVTLKQAGIMFGDAKNIVAASPALRGRFKVDQSNIAFEPTASFMRPVSSEHRGLDGLRVHIALVDELHEHATAYVVDKLRAGFKNRTQALIFLITNSGHDRTTVCWRMREYSEKVLMGIVEDDSWFAFVCGLDACGKCAAEGKTQPVDGCPDCDDWRDEAVWIKANPNLGISPTLKYLREQVREAEGMPAKANLVKRLNFCIWTEQENRIIPMDAWDSCAINTAIVTAEAFAEKLLGRSCYGALDIGSTSDFTAFDLLFPHDDVSTAEEPIDPAHPELGTRKISRRSFSGLTWFWLPEIPVPRDKQIQEAIDLWVRQGFIRRTPGNVVDYDIVLDDIIRIVKPFQFQGIGFDRGFQGSQMGNNLMKHFGEMVEQVPQGILTMNAPFRELLELLKMRRMHHDGNPVMRWMASNTAAETRGGLIKPSKDRSSEKIDGITARVMAISMAMKDVGDDDWYTPGSLRN